MVSPDEIQHGHPWPVFLATDRSLDLTCPGLAEPNSRLAQVSAGQCEIL